MPAVNAAMEIARVSPAVSWIDARLAGRSTSAAVTRANSAMADAKRSPVMSGHRNRGFQERRNRRSLCAVEVSITWLT